MAEYLPLQRARRAAQRQARSRDLAGRIQQALDGKIPARKAHPAHKYPAPPTLTHLWWVGSPFSDGRPNPIYQWDTINNQPSSETGIIDLQALAEPDSGRISLALRGGNVGSGWTQDTGYIPMPQRWEFGDETSVSGSIFLLQDLEDVISLRGDLVITCSIFNPVTDAILATTSGALDLLPGAASSLAQGLVAVTGSIVVTASILRGAETLASNYETVDFLERVAIRTDPTENQFESPGKILTADWLFSGAPNQVLDATVVVPFLPDTQDARLSVLVETEIEIAGLRWGVNAPNAGSITASFQAAGLPLFGDLTGNSYAFDLVSVRASLIQL